jgi:hypothetical protein
MSWESRVFLLQYRDFLHLKSKFPHLKSNFPCTKSDLPKSAFYFLRRLSIFFNGFLTFFNGFALSPTAFQISPMAFRFSSTAFRFPRNPRKSIYGKKYTKDCYSSFVFFATRSPSFVITDKQYVHDYPTGCCCCHLRLSPYTCGWAGWSNSIAQLLAAYDGIFVLMTRQPMWWVCC